MKAVLYTEKEYVNSETGYTCRYNYSNTENFQLHYHDYYEVFLSVSGQVLHFVNGRRHTLCEGSLMFIRPGDVHTYIRGRGEPYSFINLTFARDTIESLFSYLSDSYNSEELLTAPMPPFTRLERGAKTRIIKKLEALNTMDWRDKKKLKLNMRILLVDIFTSCFAGACTKEAVNAPEWLERLKGDLSSPEMFAEGAQVMARHCGKSREHIARSIKKYYGITASEFINGLRINYCANMLAGSDRPVLDICFESGFQNVSHFYSLFKKQYNMPPGEFRKKHSGVH